MAAYGEADLAIMHFGTRLWDSNPKPSPSPNPDPDPDPNPNPNPNPDPDPNPSPNSAGTSLWDSCAPGAIVLANGGRVTDLFGAPLVHLPGCDLKNALGVVASAPGAAARHEALP